MDSPLGSRYPNGQSSDSIYAASRRSCLDGSHCAVQPMSRAVSMKNTSKACSQSVFGRRSDRPFHPARLWEAALEAPRLPPTLRSKGFFWVAARPQRLWQWSTAGAGFHRLMLNLTATLTLTLPLP